MNDNYAVWRAELAGNVEDHQNVDTNIDGYWRLRGAKTKTDFPVAIWHTREAGIVVLRIGNKDINHDDTEWHEFIGGGWLHCTAVPKAEYDAARATGFWPADGKPAKQMSEEAKLGIDVATGGNNPPLDVAIEDQILAAVDTAKKITKVTNADEARKANEMAERLAGLYKLGDAARDKEKRPYDEASKAVQVKWLPIITPASDERTRIIKLAKDWIKAEEARLAATATADAPAPKVQAASTFGRATGLRTVKKGKITDIVKLLTALSTHKEMVEFAQTLANRAAKAGIPLDGMEIEEVRE